MNIRKPALSLMCLLFLIAFTIATATADGLHLETPHVLPGGITVNGSVEIPHGAPAGGATVALTSSDPSVTVPATVTIPARKKEAAFPIVITAVTVDTTVTLTVTMGTQSATATLIVQAPAITLLVPPTIPGGNTEFGRVKMNGPAPTGGAVVTLTSSDPSTTVPGSVTIPAGKFHADFQIITTAVTTDTTVTITANDGRLTASGTVVVKAQALHLQVPASVPGGQKTVGVLSLVDPAPAGGLAVTLSSSDPSATVPATVTIPEGRYHAAFFIVTTSVATDTTVTITATSGALTASGTLIVKAPELAGIEVRPGHVIGGNAVLGGVGLTALAGTGGVTIQLTADNAAVTVPATVTVPAGQWAITFPITTTAVSQPVVVTITATANGVTKTVQLHLR